MISRRAGLFLLVGILACGPSGAPSAATARGADRDAAASDAGTAATDAGAPERAFAGSVGEATQIINDLVDKRRDELKKCVDDFRVRKKLPREKVSLQLGIDQEGKLLGVTLKKQKDDTLTSCVSDGLRGLPFPKSHAGVITVSRTYEEIVQ